MKVSSILGNSQKLDGGAMFGNAPKALWKKWINADEENRIPLACRALLVEVDNKKILFEAGIGAFFSPELKNRYGVVEKEHVLLQSLQSLNIKPEEITDIVLSHLHFDHVGGLLTPYVEGMTPQLIFKQANIFVGAKAYERSLNPHPRDRASFIPELGELLKNHSKLFLLEKKTHPNLGEHFEFIYSDGHTPGLVISKIKSLAKTILFTSDLIPGSQWVHLPITMGYDRFPELVIDEKKQILEECVQKDFFLFYTHDHHYSASRVEKNAKGAFSPLDPVLEWRFHEL